MKVGSSSLLLLLASVAHEVDGFSILTSQMASTKPSSPTADVPTNLVDHAVAWATANGLGMMVNDENGLLTTTHAPFSLLPYGKSCLASSFCAGGTVLLQHARNSQQNS